MNLLEKIERGIDAAAEGSTGQSAATAAAVLLAITRHPSPQLLLTRRAAHLNSHGFQVAFPGGKWEAGDADLVATALRETREETSLDPALVEIKGALPKRYSKWGVEVSPFVGLVPENIETCANPAEIDHIFMVPLAFFLEQRPTRTDRFEPEGRLVEVPVWHYRDFEIWGLTALIIQDLFKALESA